jgi:hypothetical protein
MMGDILIFCIVIAALIGLLVLSYIASNKKLEGPLWTQLTAIYKFLRGIAFVFLAGLFAYGCYESADTNGWFSHDYTVSVWMTHDWLVGEFKPCVLGGDVKAPTMVCGDDYNALHEMNVQFHGSMDKLESKKESNWNCQRKEESISCSSGK